MLPRSTGSVQLFQSNYPKRLFSNITIFSLLHVPPNFFRNSDLFDLKTDPNSEGVSSCSLTQKKLSKNPVEKICQKQCSLNTSGLMNPLNQTA